MFSCCKNLLRTFRVRKSWWIDCRRNEPTQWEFNWEPGYDFFVEPGDTGTYQITFFVIDRSNQRQERTIKHLTESDRITICQKMRHRSSCKILRSPLWNWRRVKASCSIIIFPIPLASIRPRLPGGLSVPVIWMPPPRHQRMRLTLSYSAKAP